MDITLQTGYRRCTDKLLARFIPVATLFLNCISFHRAGGQFCEAYTDGDGVYHSGFQCPLSGEDGSETELVYCCGDATIKFCCEEPGSDGFGSAKIGAIIGGVFGFVILTVVCVCLCCCFCSCCFCSGRRRSPRRRGHRPLRKKLFDMLAAPKPATTTRVPAPAHIPMTITNGHFNGNYPKQQPLMVPPPVPSVPPPHIRPPVPPAAAAMAAASPYPSPSHGYPPQPAYAPQPLPHPMASHQMPPPQYNPHMDYIPQHYSPQHQYPPQAFGASPPQPPPYSPEEAPPLLDKGMAYPPAAMSGPCAPPPPDPGYPYKQ